MKHHVNQASKTHTHTHTNVKERMPQRVCCRPRPCDRQEKGHASRSRSTIGNQCSCESIAGAGKKRLNGLALQRSQFSCCDLWVTPLVTYTKGWELMDAPSFCPLPVQVINQTRPKPSNFSKLYKIDVPQSLMLLVAANVFLPDRFNKLHASTPADCLFCRFHLTLVLSLSKLFQLDWTRCICIYAVDKMWLLRNFINWQNLTSCTVNYPRSNNFTESCKTADYGRTIDYSWSF